MTTVPNIILKQHDLRPVVQGTLYDPPVPPSTTYLATDLTSCTVRLLWRHTTLLNVKFSASATIVGSPSNGVVQYQWVSGDTDVVGDYNVEWEVINAGGKPRTYPTKDYLLMRIVANLS